MCWWQWVAEPAEGLTGERERRIEKKFIVTETQDLKN